MDFVSSHGDHKRGVLPNRLRLRAIDSDSRFGKNSRALCIARSAGTLPAAGEGRMVQCFSLR